MGDAAEEQKSRYLQTTALKEKALSLTQVEKLTDHNQFSKLEEQLIASAKNTNTTGPSSFSTTLSQSLTMPTSPSATSYASTTPTASSLISAEGMKMSEDF